MKNLFLSPAAFCTVTPKITAQGEYYLLIGVVTPKDIAFKSYRLTLDDFGLAVCSALRSCGVSSAEVQIPLPISPPYNEDR